MLAAFREILWMQIVQGLQLALAFVTTISNDGKTLKLQRYRLAAIQVKMDYI